MLEHCGSLGGELLRCSVRSDCVVGSNISSAPPKSTMSSLGIAETNFKAGNRRVKSLQLRLETLDLLSAELCQGSALTN
jgi:hypothetical protein